MYKYRLYPSKKQQQTLFKTLNICKEIYNQLLETNINIYESTEKTLQKFDYNKLLTGFYPEIYAQVKQNISDRVHKSFQNFFRRCKDDSAKKKGFPRFKSRINSITYPQFGFKFLSQRRLHVSKIGNIPIVLHRIPKGKLKTMTIKVNGVGQWFAIFACEAKISKVKHSSSNQVGIDVGLENFATTSDREHINNPRFFVKSEKRLKRLDRQLYRKKKGGTNRIKAKLILVRQYLKISNQRTDFLHKTSFQLTKRYSFIAVENLDIKEMMHNHHLAKHISDASWNSFIHMLSYKAVTCGGQLVKTDPRNTSKTCSNCGAIADMPLNQRMYSCSVCGFVCHRDLNASINILKIGQGLPESNACGHDVRPSSKMAAVDEAGTILGNS